jgi:hypothetical protein
VIGESVELKNVTSMAAVSPGEIVAGVTLLLMLMGGVTSRVGTGPASFCAHDFDFAAVSNDRTRPVHGPGENTVEEGGIGLRAAFDEAAAGAPEWDGGGEAEIEIAGADVDDATWVGADSGVTISRALDDEQLTAPTSVSTRIKPRSRRIVRTCVIANL